MPADPSPTDEVTWLRYAELTMTPGPWEAQRAHEGWDVAPVTDDAGMRGPDAVGIATLRNLAPSMLAVIELAAQLHKEMPPYDYAEWEPLGDALSAFRSAVREEQSR